MLIHKRIQLLFSSLVLLISLISVSGHAAMSSNFDAPKTELVSHKPSLKNTFAAPYKRSAKTYQTVIFNQFRVFNFKCLLNIHGFDFSLTLKSQKEVTLQFLNYELLEQHVIAQINASNYQYNFIK